MSLWPWSAWKEEEFGGVTEDMFTKDVPYATIDGEDKIVGEIKSVVTIQALTNSVMYCNIYPTNTPLFLKQYSWEQV